MIVLVAMSASATSSFVLVAAIASAFSMLMAFTAFFFMMMTAATAFATAAASAATATFATHTVYETLYFCICCFTGRDNAATEVKGLSGKRVVKIHNDFVFFYL
jgi:hypothetical protein